MKATVLGSGTSHGIPVVGCGCPVCTSPDSRDKRMRASLYIEGPGDERIIIDTGPEFRLQAVQAGIKKLDAVFLTHPHADHLHGLDDVRPLSHDRPLKVYGNKLTIEEMTERFSYVFRETQPGGGKPRLEPVIIENPVRIGALTISPVPVKHGLLDILGWYVTSALPEGASSPEENAPKAPEPRGLLYLTDTSALPPETAAALPQPEILIIGGLRVRPHSTHFNFEQALETALALGAQKVYLTHICHEHFHREIEEFCENFKKTRNLEGEMHPAWDGLTLPLRGGETTPFW
ncbi:MAG: MBL fold metallo-hydrolase [Treponema sp.]|jgi:phosphoribosyl 1,2-cyclic phosphate phosphodiesterase|nr:MBL fold metallo-hydrolase [Treponema sp.]